MYDFCVVGGGIVGVATARRLLEVRPGASLVLLEKAEALAVHQTGHNSGVIHSGIYYEPGSLKARLCKLGAEQTKQFAAAHGIDFDVRGKLLVATDSGELTRMRALDERARINGIDVETIDAAELRRREPHVAGLGALYVPSTGIIDYRQVVDQLAAQVRNAGGEIRCGAEVSSIIESSSGVAISGESGSWSARQLVVCGGLQADRLARIAGIRSDVRIVPFRGEYYQLPADRRDLVHHLIYPIPDPELPFLGVHLNAMIDGSLTVGPNAVLGLSREGYRKGSVRWDDVRDIFGYRGFYSLARANVRTGARELRNSLFKRGYLAQCRMYCPELTLADLLPREAGIRAQAVRRDGTLVHDFLIERTDRSVHVLNAPSPAATSALPIAEHIVDTLLGA
ncbi:L-2-hydroxyglutarate oxidase [Skermania sp. ID1734]|uniref:L-2-hydroxyglutarate oxidase n=1 Tax=Skermania sp. ID1734 TaxID=2597516 RepID=UPI00117DEBB6|nr:L-2-hydroxyglutarate oxidase [Skermania sp. ID1734]TSD99779.1 L-2-hydroxyglutarate oxidase [Skermania sp. ID1734]